MGERTPTNTFTQNRLLASTSGRTGRIKFDGYRVIARKDGEQVRLWARTTSDYSCSQPGPDGGLSASAGWQGSMKPGGLERERIGRETRQSIRNQRTGEGRTGPGTGIYANLGGITNRSTGAYSPGMAAWEPPKTIGHARAGGEKALTVHCLGLLSSGGKDV